MAGFFDPYRMLFGWHSSFVFIVLSPQVVQFGVESYVTCDDFGVGEL